MRDHIKRVSSHCLRVSVVCVVRHCPGNAPAGSSSVLAWSLEDKLRLWAVGSCYSPLAFLMAWFCVCASRGRATYEMKEPRLRCRPLVLGPHVLWWRFCH
ncbi:hypothetical protein R3I93_008628 [Phoxinus phoxinus]|uniref:Uncharacterized protein n=1 Tax=Phoxinus phoxinus TaxID=58324 RepID=A0AAN9H9T0_9TELE